MYVCACTNKKKTSVKFIHHIRMCVYTRLYAAVVCTYMITFIPVSCWKSCKNTPMSNLRRDTESRFNTLLSWELVYTPTVWVCIGFHDGFHIESQHKLVITGAIPNLIEYVIYEVYTYMYMYLCMIFQLKISLHVFDAFPAEPSFNDACISANSGLTSPVLALRIFARVFKALSFFCFLANHL